MTLHLQFRNYGTRCECVNAEDCAGNIQQEYIGRLFCDVCNEFGIYHVDDVMTYFLGENEHYLFKCRLMGGIINFYVSTRK